MQISQRNPQAPSVRSTELPYKQLLVRYARLKVKYFEFLDSSDKSKGHIRAYVGIRTWLHEREALAGGTADYTAHVASLEKALELVPEELRDSR